MRAQGDLLPPIRDYRGLAPRCRSEVAHLLSWMHPCGQPLEPHHISASGNEETAGGRRNSGNTMLLCLCYMP